MRNNWNLSFSHLENKNSESKFCSKLLKCAHSSLSGPWGLFKVKEFYFFHLWNDLHDVQSIYNWNLFFPSLENPNSESHFLFYASRWCPVVIISTMRAVWVENNGIYPCREWLFSPSGCNTLKFILPFLKTSNSGQNYFYFMHLHWHSCHYDIHVGYLRWNKF